MTYLLVGRLAGWLPAHFCDSSNRPSSSLLNRHLGTTREWFPHEHIPYGRGRDAIDGEVWEAADADLGGARIDDAVRSALIVNLLTEDNLPYYFRTIERTFGADGAWGEWVRRWTAEEGRHSMAIYGYLMVTRAVDPDGARTGPHGPGLRRARPRARLAGRRPGVRGAAGTGHPHRPPQHRSADRRSGRLQGDDACRRRREPAPPVLPGPHRGGDRRRPERDGAERSSGRSSTSRCPAGGSRASPPTPPRSPGPASTTSPSTTTRSSLPVVLSHWKLEQLAGLDTEAERARDRIMTRLAKSERVARRLAERRPELVEA